MFNQQAMTGSFIIDNFELDVSELISYFAQYDSMYFFCPKNTRTAIETAIKLTLDSICDYNPLKINRNLMTCLMEDMEVYQANNPHPSLNDSEFLDKIDIITEQIEECVDFVVRKKLPINQQCNILCPKWRGNTLVFALRIY